MEGTGRASSSGPGWAFASVCAAYLAVTVGEALLAPAFPAVADDLGLDLAGAGLAFGLLTGAISAGSILGGFALARGGAKFGVLMALGVTASGALLAASAHTSATFLVSQALLGLGAGGFFAPGVSAAGALGGVRRRGFLLGLFGVAFSTGLATAAFLAAGGPAIGWRTAFLVAAAFAAVGAVAVAFSPMPPRRAGPQGGRREPLRAALGMASVVGAVGAVCQYGIVSFFPQFAVAQWSVAPASAALILAAARMLAVPAKLVAGRAADKVGGRVVASALGILLTASGLWWTLVPGATASAVPAVVFIAAVSTVFPIANLLALDDFGDRGPLLGLYRAVQMGVGALAGVGIGAAAATWGLRPTLAVVMLTPVGLSVVLSLRRPGSHHLATEPPS